MVSRINLTVLGTVVALAIAVGACNGGHVSTDDAREQAIEVVRGRSSGAQRADLYHHLDELLPNVTFRAPSGREATAVRAVVVGRVVEAREGSGYVDRETGSEVVAFDSREADWRSVHVRVEVDEVLGSAPGRWPRSIWVGYSVGSRADGEALRRGLEAFGRVVLFLDPPGFYRDDPGSMIVHEDGALTGMVDAHGILTFPMREEQPGFTGSLRTLAALEAAAKGAPRTIEVPADEAYRFAPEVEPGSPASAGLSPVEVLRDEG
jgi:hypothetical protein